MYIYRCTLATRTKYIRARMIGGHTDRHRRTRTHVRTHARTHARTHTHTDTHTVAHNTLTHTHTQWHTHTHTLRHTHTHTHSATHTHTHTDHHHHHNNTDKHQQHLIPLYALRVVCLGKRFCSLDIFISLNKVRFKPTTLGEGTVITRTASNILYKNQEAVLGH